MLGIILLNCVFDVNSNINHDETPNYQSNINNTPVEYEASGYCSYVVDGDTIDVDGVAGYVLLV